MKFLGWLLNRSKPAPKQTGSSTGDHTKCLKCGATHFEHKAAFDEYYCTTCGWALPSPLKSELQIVNRDKIANSSSAEGSRDAAVKKDRKSAKTLPEWRKMLKDSDPEIRAQAEEFFRKTGYDRGEDLSNKITEDGTALIDAAGEGNLGEIRTLLKSGVNINGKRSDGATALIFAAYKGHAAAVDILLKNGADVNARMSNGATPLILAAQNNYFDIVENFLKKGADVNIRADGGNAALITATVEGFAEIVNLLLKNSADVNIKTSSGESPLIFAAKGGYLDIVKVLLNNGADVNIKTNEGHTPLIIASNHGHVDVAIALLRNNAAVHIKAKSGKAALYFAEKMRHKEIIRLLQQYGAKGSAKPTKDKQSGFEQLVNELIKIGWQIAADGYDSGFLRQGGIVKHPQAWEIGKELYEMGGRQLDVMRRAHALVQMELGSAAANELSCCWDEIGIEEWKAGRGSCWSY